MSELDAIEIDSLSGRSGIKYSICTLLTNESQYIELLSSFRDAGFSGSDCEYLYVDNRQRNKYDAYAAVNLFLRRARGEYIIICHQDLLLHADKRDSLDRKIDEISKLDKNWALLGNAGGAAPGILASNLTEFSGDHKHYLRQGDFPVKVRSLDENFIVVKGSANLSVSNDLAGFHLYGTDICIIAELLGYSAYVIDFHLWHLGGASVEAISAGRSHTDVSFQESRNRLIQKYQKAFLPRFIQTTCTMFYVSSSELKNYLFNNKTVFSIRRRLERLIGRAAD